MPPTCHYRLVQLKDEGAFSARLLAGSRQRWYSQGLYLRRSGRSRATPPKPSFRQSEPTFELRHEDVVGVTDTDIPLAGLGVTTHFSTTQRDHCLTCGRGPVRGMRV